MPTHTCKGIVQTMVTTMTQFDISYEFSQITQRHFYAPLKKAQITKDLLSFELKRFHPAMKVHDSFIWYTTGKEVQTWWEIRPRRTAAAAVAGQC